MTWLQAVALGTLQGTTEFLPISSSAHLALLPWLLGWEDPGLTFDVALHMGTLAALLLYFGGDWLALARGAWRDPRSREGRTLAWLALATLPAGLSGLLLEDYAEGVWRSPPLMAATVAGFGLLLAWAQRRGAKDKAVGYLGWLRALRIGLGQALAVIPGVSRSGITITVGLLEGLTEVEAARLSFLLSAPIIAGAGLHKLRHLGPTAVDGPFWAGIAASALTGWLSIRILLGYVGRCGYRPFVLYRLGLGAAILGIWLLRA